MRNYNDIAYNQIYDSVTDKYYALKPDEKLVHVNGMYAVDDITGKPYQKVETRIVKIGDDNSIIWSSEQEIIETQYRGHTVRTFGKRKDVLDTPINLNNYPNTGVARELSFIESLQKEVNEWLLV